MKGAENLRIAKNIRINRKDLMNLRKINSKVLSQFEYAISRTSELAHDPKKADPIDRALTAVRKFGRIGDAEIVTPQKIARQMVDQIQDAEWKKMVVDGEKILDLASKIGEFAIAVSRKLNRDCGLPVGDFRSSICAIATSDISYEFTRKVYELLGLDTSCVADPERLTSYKLLEVKTDGKIDYGKIARILRQRKPFNTISTNDTVGERARKMNTFGAALGNPPYQLETSTKKSETNGQVPRVSIFQYVQNVADSVTAHYSSLIYPGKRWLHRSGKGMEEFGLQQINDVHLSHVDYFAPNEPVFDVVEIADGITIVLKDAYKESHNFGYAYHENGLADECVLTSPGDSLMPLNPKDGRVVEKANKYCASTNKTYLSERLLPRSLFGIESEFVELHPTKVRPFEKGARFDLGTEIKLFTNDKAGKAGRAKWFIANRNVIKVNRQYIDEWQVVVSSANAGGQKRDWQIELVDNHSAFGRARVGLGSFKTRREAENFYKYCTSYLIRFLFLMTDEALTSLAKQVPDIQNYTDKNGLIDFKGDVNKQLYRLFGLTDSEIKYVEKTIKDIDASRSRKAKGVHE